MRRVLWAIPLAAAWLLLGVGPGRGEDEPATAIPADERILSFSCDINVLADGSLDVRETIRVRSARQKIRHGIYRDFPTRLRSMEGIWYEVPLNLTEVRRDGQPEPWETKEEERGLRAYIGSTQVLLEPGEHTYTIAYHTDRQLGFFPDHDELFWNVNGYEWTLPVDEVEAHVRLPHGVSGVTLGVQTGARDSKGQDATSSWDPKAGAFFRTKRPFREGEGLTVIVKWPKGYVQAPVEPRVWWWYFASSNRSAVAGLAGFLLVLTYYIITGRQQGRDPQRGAIVPRGEVPEGLPPAAVRAVRTGTYDVRGLAATLVQMAVKGYLVIEERAGTYALRRGAADDSVLSPEEALVAEDLKLGKAERLEIARANLVQIGDAVIGLKNFFRAWLVRFSVHRNREALFLGSVVSLLVLLATLTLEPGLRSWSRALLAVLMYVWTIGLSLLIVQLAYRWWDVHLRRGPLRATLFHAASITVFSIPFLVAEAVGIGLLVWQGSYAYGMIVLGVALVNVRFLYLFKTAPFAGGVLLDKIEGFSAWLAAADADGGCRPGPPLDPTVYERFLPYAIALEREEQWSLQWAAELARAGEGGRGYQPAWYRDGAAAAEWRPGPFALSVGGALCAAISAAVPQTPAPSAMPATGGSP